MEKLVWHPAPFQSPSIGFGCKDTDLDGQSDLNDFLEFEPTQWNDTDSDGFGDNLYGFQGDSCVFDAGSSFENKFGCPDQDLDGWSDFGGSRENNETTFQTAIREGCEELNGFLNCKSLKKYVKKHLVTSYEIKTYVTYLFYIPYNEFIEQLK